jgi:hypothetical protein
MSNQSQKTARVRALVIFGKNGIWNAVGDSTADDAQIKEWAIADCSFLPADFWFEHWIDVDVPLPIPQGGTFEAEVVTKC